MRALKYFGIAMLGALTCVALSVHKLPAQSRTLNPDSPTPRRPAITGVAFIMLRSSDFRAAEQFYGKVLGLAEVTSILNIDPLPPQAGGQVKEPLQISPALPEVLSPHVGSATGHIRFYVNEHQYVEILPELSDPKQDRLVAIGFETADQEELEKYLTARSVPILGHTDPTNPGFIVQDPDGHLVAFVQYSSGRTASLGLSNREGKRISQRMIHVGVTVQDSAAADRFYKDILGFKDIWHGGMKDDRTDWVDMRVPEGTDWLEYMLNVHNPSPKTLGVMHHLALGVPSVAEGYKTVLGRDLNPEKPKIGRDGKWQLNLYDPNLTRVELMEPKPVQTPCCSPMRQ